MCFQDEDSVASELTGGYPGGGKEEEEDALEWLSPPLAPQPIKVSGCGLKTQPINYGGKWAWQVNYVMGVMWSFFDLTPTSV